jgi:hypothetical protein
MKSVEQFAELMAYTCETSWRNKIFQFGRELGYHAGQKGEMTAHESLYRVTLKADGASNENQLVAVSARIDSERSSFLLDSFRKAAGVVIKESGL